ncbi:hypothetical protein I547_6968 [Mycobacterium kansasii 824]|nr:hypothetical protein I547_6968 [Mycobacterium kansasii 824]
MRRSNPPSIADGIPGQELDYVASWPGPPAVRPTRRRRAHQFIDPPIPLSGSVIQR